MKNKDIVIWQGIKAQIIGGSVDLAYNNGMGYKIKLLEGQNLVPNKRARKSYYMKVKYT